MLSLRPAAPADAPLLRRWDDAPHVVNSDPNDDWGWETELDPLASNVRAHRFCERLGFRLVERRRFGADDCYVYRLERRGNVSTHERQK